MSELEYSDLEADVDNASAELPAGQKRDQKFTYWFMKAYLTEDSSLAKHAVCGGPKDRGIDGIFIDDSAETVYLIQSKYRKTISIKNEPAEEIKKFTSTINTIFSPEPSVSREFFENMEGATARLARNARNRVLKRKFAVKFLYVTTGKRPLIHTMQAERRINRDSKKVGVNAVFLSLGGIDVMKLLREYRDGVAPPIPRVKLEVEEAVNIRSSNIYRRQDQESKIHSWMITMSGDKVAALFKTYGVRIFARNIRGYLGMSTKGINKKIENTLQREPDKFYYYNNGITMVCNSVEDNGQFLTVENPQIINGQQTTRVLASTSRAQSKKVGVMVKVIEVPRKSESDNKNFERMVSKIVDGTNRQNAISQADLISNHKVQIELHRNMKPLGYIYLRKKMSRTEAKRIWGNFGKIFINKDDFARASAATQFDQHVVRSGVNHLYEDHLYDKVFPSSDPLFYLPRYYV
ncbi:AIPR family protein, partial [Halioglobus sp.]|nr:AIPR family protein [Halioglobus sp.]